MLVLPATAPCLAAADADESVRTGRNALHRWTNYPWYDAQHDELQPVKVKAPAEPEPDGPPRNPVRRTGRVWCGSWPGPSWRWCWGSWSFCWLRAFVPRQRERRPADEVPDDGDAARIESLPFPVAAGRMDLLAEARRHYQAGNYGAAIVYLFSFQLVQLDRRQIIRLAKGKTNRQYMREVGPRDSLRSLVEQTMVVFRGRFLRQPTSSTAAASNRVGRGWTSLKRWRRAGRDDKELGMDIGTRMKAQDQG